MPFVCNLPALLKCNSVSRDRENKPKKQVTSHTDILAIFSTSSDMCPTHENPGMFYFAHFDFLKNCGTFVNVYVASLSIFLPGEIFHFD